MGHTPAGGTGGTGEPPIVAKLALGAQPDPPRQARRLVHTALADAGLAGLVDDTSSVATELVTNALLHAGGISGLVLRIEVDGTVRIEVSDPSAALPVRARRNEEAMTGRGLALVDALVVRWGVDRNGVGKVVWAELREGYQPDPEDVDADELLARWGDLDTLLEPLAEDEPHYTVQLGDVPTDLLLAAKAHVDNLVREFALAAAGARAGMTSAVPEHLAELIESVVHRFAAARESIKRQALAAAHAEEDHVRLELRLPADAADAGEEYLAALDQADDYCRAARLLTMESPPQHRVFRQWYVGELVAQLRRAAAGEKPVPAETFEQRLLREIDAIAAAERAAARSARLHTLSAVLASAVTPEAVTQAVLSEGAAALRASGGAVLLASGSSTLALPGAIGYGERVVAQLRHEPADAELPAAHALRTGEAVWLESRGERDRRFPALAGLEPGTMSICAVPLVVSDRSLGALRFSFSDARLFDEDERRFVLAMASQTAQALDRAQLYAQRLQVSERLQRSLLPPRLPDIPTMNVDATYHPLGRGIDVGGDFYDVWPCAGGWAFAIGDASGTGPEAAAMTALVRHTLRALTLTEMPKDLVLQHLNRALQDAHMDAGDDRFCTVLLGSVDVQPDRAVIDIVGGGHPAPLVVRADGKVEEVELYGSLLGLLDAATVDQRTVELWPGDEILLYTDGVTDTRRGRDFFDLVGVHEGIANARRHGRGLVAELADAVRRHGGGQMGDDVAMLALRFDGTA